MKFTSSLKLKLIYVFRALLRTGAIKITEQTRKDAKLDL